MFPSNRKWLRSPSERVGTLSHADLPPPPPRDDEERLLVRALRERDEAAFEQLLDRFYSPMMRLARTYVRSRDEAEEVVQDAWLAVLAGIDRFEGRSSLKTWIFRILVNRARTRAKREARQLPFSSLQRPSGDADGDGGLHPEWLFSPEASTSLTWPGRAWEPPSPEAGVLAGELRDRIEAAIRALPPRQQEVITLRDLEGWSPEEACEALGLSQANQRVLLHRARLKVRDALDAYFTPIDPDRSEPTPCTA